MVKRRPRVRSSGQLMSAAFPWQRYSPLILIVFSLCLFGYSIYRPASLGGVRTTVSDLAAPALALINTPIQQAASYVRAASGIAQLQEENNRLLMENIRLREWYQTAMTLKAENMALQDLLNIPLPQAQRFVTARVIGDSGGSYVKSLLVMAGHKDGVQKGYAVLASEGVLGRIIEAGNKASRVLLMTDINSRIPVLLEASDKSKTVKAILAGNNSEYPVLSHVPPESNLQEGARIITSGHGGMYPYGLPVGELIKNNSGEWLVRPYADTFGVTFVRITDGGDPRLSTGNINLK